MLLFLKVLLLTLSICGIVWFMYLILDNLYHTPKIFMWINTKLKRYTFIITYVEIKEYNNKNYFILHYGLGYNHKAKRYEIFNSLTSESACSFATKSCYSEVEFVRLRDSYEIKNKGEKHFFIDLQTYDNKVFLNKDVVTLYLDKLAEYKTKTNNSGIAEQLLADFSVSTFNKKTQYTAMKIAENK